MAKSLSRRVQEAQVALRREKRAAEERRIKALAAKRNRQSMEAYRLEKLNKAKQEQLEAERWLKKEKERKRALKESQKRRTARPVASKSKFAGRKSTGKKIGRTVDKGLRKLFKVGR